MVAENIGHDGLRQRSSWLLYRSLRHGANPAEIGRIQSKTVTLPTVPSGLPPILMKC